MDGSADDVRLELDVPPPARARPSLTWILAVPLVASGILEMPYGFGLAVALPALFVWIGLRLVRVPERGFSVRVRTDALEIGYGAVVERIEWDEIAEVRDGVTGATIPLTHGRELVIPRTILPDVATLAAVMPEHVRVVRERPQQTPSQTWRTVGLWVLLVGILYTIARIGE